MSELPEKKVLKDLLTNLKKKTITYNDELKKTEETLGEPVQRYRAQLLKAVEGDDLKTSPAVVQTLYGLIRFMDTIELHIKNYSNLVRRNCDETALYIEALEKYSTELDNTLTSIFEQATKQAEEQIKQQEETSKKDTSSAYRS